jgi:hypothetical protein
VMRRSERKVNQWSICLEAAFRPEGCRVEGYL